MVLNRLRIAAEKTITAIGTPGARIVQAAVPDLRPTSQPPPKPIVQAAAQIARLPFLPAESVARVITAQQQTQRQQADLQAAQQREQQAAIQRMQEQQQRQEAEAQRRLEAEIARQEQEAQRRIEQEVQRQEQEIMDQIREIREQVPPAPIQEDRTITDVHGPPAPSPAPNGFPPMDSPPPDFGSPGPLTGTMTAEAPGLGGVALIGAAGIGAFLLFRRRQ